MKATTNVLANLVDAITEGVMIENDQESLTAEQRAKVDIIAAAILKSVPDLQYHEAEKLISGVGESYAGVAEMLYHDWSDVAPDEFIELLAVVRDDMSQSNACDTFEADLEEKAREYIGTQFEARGYVVESVTFTEDETIRVLTSHGRLYVMTIGSDDDEYRFFGPDNTVIRFSIEQE